MKRILEILARQNELLSQARSQNRAMTEDEVKEFDEFQKELNDLQQRNAENGSSREEGGEAAAPEAPEGDAPTDGQRAVQEERTRIAEISGLARSFGLDPTDAINNGVTIDSYRTTVLEGLKKSHGPVSTGVRVQADEEDKFRAAAVDGLILRNGEVNIKTPAAGADEFRGTSLRDIGIECLRRAGEDVNSLLRMSPSEIYDRLGERQFYNPSASFPAIMDQTIRKTIVEMYNHVPTTTFEQITTKGSLPDFKETSDHEYVLSKVGDWLEVPENGEIKPDMPTTELLPTMKLKTYGKQFSMTRQAFINDDIGFLTRIPGRFAQAAKETIDKQVYSILTDNPAIFDGKTMFHADHNNLLATGSKPSIAVLQQMIMMMQLQKDQFGEYINVNPSKIIVPVGWAFDLHVLFHSSHLPGTDHNDINTMYNYPLGILETTRLNQFAGSNPCPWYMMADTNSCRGIQVNYLNGQETPNVRRMETVGQLGYTWDMWLDWGVAVRDFRGFLKNPGVALS